MFKSEKEKREAEKGANNALVNSKPYSSKELENFKKLLLTPCSYCSGTGQDPYDNFSDCNTCNGQGVLNPNIDSRRILSTIAVLMKEYSSLKEESRQIKEVFNFINKEMEEE